MIDSFSSIKTSSSVYSDRDDKENQDPKKIWSFVNPYSQSLWFLSRGNEGQEIKDMLKKTEELNQTGKTITVVRPPDKKLPPLPAKLLTDFPTPVRDSFEDSRAQVIVSLEQQYIQDLDLLNAVCSSFAAFVDDHGIPLSSTEITTLFGNVNLMTSLSELLVNNLLSRFPLEQTLDDHFTRMIQVYPSYMALHPKRMGICHSILNDPRYKPWVDSLQGINVEKLVEVPYQKIARLKETLTTLELLETCPKFQKLLDVRSSLPSPVTAPAVLLHIPELWKEKYKQKWKEIMKEPFEYQQLVFFQHEFKLIHHTFNHTIKKMDQSLKYQKQTMLSCENIGTVFVHLYKDLPDNNSSGQLTPRSLFFKDSFITSSYELYLEKSKTQSNIVNKLMSKFEYSLGPMVEEMSATIELASHKIAKLQKTFHKIDRDTKISKLTTIYQLNGQLRAALLLIAKLYEKYVASTLLVFRGRSESAEKIVENYVNLRQQNKQIAVSSSNATFDQSLALTKVVRRLYH
ncbi:hypothetical protein OGAPHI_003831 [Ogataea philodendri]|uniref:DH domain-containing protein n=1 Tax=Ogataea philodendri TaxID=1378263 RepID=A0A9P8T472_9ASCO|nr:uncharacterized protein OGAPHI_003831 [Ogataea philodendri]KAH3665643.1 hypothetical protein OGAPHI_003831 [Ogataea philodendri]